MINLRAVAGWCLGTLLVVSIVSAEPVPGQPVVWNEAIAYEPQVEPAADPIPPEASASQASQSRLRHMAFGGFDIGVPIMLAVDSNLIRPGANLHAQGGLDIGYVAFFVHGGWRWIPVDFERAAKHGHPEYEGEGRDPLKNPHFGFGLRGQIPNRTRLLPYLSASFDINFWNFRESNVACAGGYYYWYCNDYSVYKFTPGFSGRLGTAIDVARGLYVDFGLGVSMSFEGKFFDENEVWLEPFAGVGYRR